MLQSIRHRENPVQEPRQADLPRPTLGGEPDDERAPMGLRKKQACMLEFSEECRGYHHEQSDRTLRLRHNGLIAGWIDYNVWQGTPTVQMIWVEPDFRRQGLGTKLMQELQRRHPGVEIHLGLSTDEGAALIESIRFKTVPSEFEKMFEALETARKEEARLQSVADAFFERADQATEAERAAFNAEMERFNEVHDQIWGLEEATNGESPVKRLVVLPEEEP